VRVAKDFTREVYVDNKIINAIEEIHAGLIHTTVINVKHAVSENVYKLEWIKRVID
jgi:hypothetical protein